MSVENTSWAFNSPVNLPVERLLLIWLSNYADKDGYISADPVNAAKFCCTDERGIRETWMSLWGMGLIEMTDGQPRLAVEIQPAPQREPQWTPSATLRAEMIEAAGGKCVACGSDDRLCLDHIIPRSRGGSNDRSNLQVLCLRCNSSKRDRENWAGRA